MAEKVKYWETEIKVNVGALAPPAIHTVPPLPFTVIEVEALAARQALEFAMEIGVDRVILEGDSEFLINALRVAAVPLHNLVILRMMCSTLPLFSQL